MGASKLGSLSTFQTLNNASLAGKETKMDLEPKRVRKSPAPRSPTNTDFPEARQHPICKGSVRR